MFRCSCSMTKMSPAPPSKVLPLTVHTPRPSPMNWIHRFPNLTLAADYEPFSSLNHFTVPVTLTVCGGAMGGTAVVSASDITLLLTYFLLSCFWIVSDAGMPAVGELCKSRCAITFPRFSPGLPISRSGAFQTLLPLCGSPGIHRRKRPGY